MTYLIGSYDCMPVGILLDAVAAAAASLIGLVRSERDREIHT